MQIGTRLAATSVEGILRQIMINKCIKRIKCLPVDKIVKQDRKGEKFKPTLY